MRSTSGDPGVRGLRVLKSAQTTMFVQAVVAIFFSLVAAQVPDGFQLCKNSNPLFDVKTMVVSPVIAGKDMQVTVSGFLSKVVVDRGSNLHLSAKWGFLTILNDDLDICEQSSRNGGKSCPFLPDEATLQGLTFSKGIPSVAPNGVKLNVFFILNLGKSGRDKPLG